VQRDHVTYLEGRCLFYGQSMLHLPLVHILKQHFATDSELGDVAHALEYDHESAEIGCSHGIPNVEISALINLGLNYLALDQVDRARSYLAL
jgi:hypothetical protein